MRSWLLLLALLWIPLSLAFVDHYNTLGVARTASPSQIRQAFTRLAKQWHPDKNPTPEAEEKYKEITAAYEVLSDPQKRNEYELGFRHGHVSFRSSQRSTTDTVELTAANWDWNMKSANFGQGWLVLFCSDGYAGCPAVYSEWEKAYQMLGPFIRMGRVNVNDQWRIVNGFGIRYVPSIYAVEDGDLLPFKGAMRAEELYRYVRNSMPNVFTDIRNMKEWRSVFDWESRLNRDGIDGDEKVRIVLFSDDRQVPLKWRYWSDHYSDRIEWYLIHKSFASKQLLEMLGSSFGVHHSGVAMLFPNPRDNSEVVILSDPDTSGECIELTSADMETWIESQRIPKIAKIDSSSFLHIVDASHLTLLMAVDTSIGSPFTPASSSEVSSGAEFAKSSKFGNSRLKRFAKLIEPMSTLWEQRRGSNTKDILFAWFGTHKQKFAESFGIFTPVKDGQLILIDRQRMEFAILTLDIDKDDISAFVNTILKYSLRQLHMRKLQHVPQSTDDDFNLSAALASASSFGYIAIGIGLVIVFGASLVMRSSPSSQKPPDSKAKPQKESHHSSKKESNTNPSSSSKTHGSESTASSSDEGSSRKSSQKKQQQEMPKSSGSHSSEFHRITLASWHELRLDTYETIFSKKNFTMILFPRLDRKEESRQWELAVRTAAFDLSTDSVNFAWAHPHLQRRYVTYWKIFCDGYIMNTTEGQDGTQTTYGILFHSKKNRFMIFTGDSHSSTYLLDSTKLVSFIQRVLEGQTSWIDVPSDAPELGS